MREPDWKALADLQFLLYNRIADSLNAAMSAIALSDMPEAQDKSPSFWKDRATAKVGNVLNMFMAWSYLIHYKLGEMLPDRAIRPFRVNALLEWLGVQLQLTPTPTLPSDPLLHANQETLQEALLLLYSAAFTQGTSVRLELETIDKGVWFRVLFSRLTPLPESFDALLDSYGSHWRAQDTVFELATARDFIRLNGSEIEMSLTKQQGAFSFFVRQTGVIKDKSRIVQGSLETPLMLEEPDEIPVKAEARDVDATPVISQEEIDGIPVLPPTLAALRPRPGMVSVPAPAPKEGQTPPIEPEERSPKAPFVPHEDYDTHISMKTAILPPLPPALQPQKSKPAPEKPKSVIVPIKIPPPTPPSALRKPPAATSNVALPKETTQTLRPVSGDSTEEPNAAKDETKILPAQNSTSREENS